MAKGFKHGAGGVGLNFKVICNPQPETAKENTIWVDTDRINNYYFSVTEPEGMAEYDVWFPVGTSSSVAFSATKKNPVMIYPLSAKQYIGGAWVDKTAKSWQGGEWVEWIVYLIKDGNITAFANSLGGFATRGLALNSGNPSAKEPAVTITDDYIQLHLASPDNKYWGGAYYLAEKINLTNYKTLKVDVDATMWGTGGIDVRVWSDFGSYAGDNNESVSDVFSTDHVASTMTERRVVDLDISGSNGERFIGIWLLSPPSNFTPCTAKIYDWWLE